MRRAALVGLAVAGAVFGAVMLVDGSDDRTTAPVRASAPDGQAVFAEMGCGSCHRLAAAGSTGKIGPDLDERLEAHTRASLREKILDPASGRRYSMMPSDFGERMSDGQLDALLDFLLRTRGGKT